MVLAGPHEGEMAPGNRQDMLPLGVVREDALVYIDCAVGFGWRSRVSGASSDVTLSVVCRSSASTLSLCVRS